MTLEETQLNSLRDFIASSDFPAEEIRETRAVGGGSINDTYRLITDQEDLFVKINRSDRYPDMFRLEADGLNDLRNSDSFRVPRVIGICHYGHHDMLLLEYIAEGKKNQAFWETLGQQLARLHKNYTDYFGYSRSNYIGSLVQVNDHRSSWTDFFVEQRLEPMIRLAGNKLEKSDRRSFALLFHRLDELIPTEPPSLLHGDLWSGNYLADSDGAPVLIDPAVYYGHREMDLAMMHLFGGFASEVFSHYHNAYPLEPGWQDRLDLHNLYPLLVHVNLFGGSYLNSLRANLRKYL